VTTKQKIVKKDGADAKPAAPPPAASISRRPSLKVRKNGEIKVKAEWPSIPASGGVAGPVAQNR